MKQDWQDLTAMTRGKEIVISKVEVSETGVAIEGKFELPPLAKFSMEDQIFIAAFIKTHGSIKEMERLFGVSYPTIKNRLRKICEELEFINLEASEISSPKSVLKLLEEGKISVKEAIEEIER